MSYLESIAKAVLYAIFRFETEHDRQGRIARMQCELDLQRAMESTK